MPRSTLHATTFPAPPCTSHVNADVNVSRLTSHNKIRAGSCARARDRGGVQSAAASLTSPLLSLLPLSLHPRRSRGSSLLRSYAKAQHPAQRRLAPIAQDSRPRCRRRKHASTSSLEPQASSLSDTDANVGSTPVPQASSLEPQASSLSDTDANGGSTPVPQASSLEPQASPIPIPIPIPMPEKTPPAIWSYRRYVNETPFTKGSASGRSTLASK